MFEYGFLQTLQTRKYEAYMLRTQKSLKVYETLEDFVTDISGKFSMNVKLYNITNLFFYFGGFLVLVLLVFVTNIFLLKKLKTINRKLVRCLKKCRINQLCRVAFCPNFRRFKIDKLRIWNRLHLAKGIAKRLGK